MTVVDAEISRLAFCCRFACTSRDNARRFRPRDAADVNVSRRALWETNKNTKRLYLPAIPVSPRSSGDRRRPVPERGASHAPASKDQSVVYPLVSRNENRPTSPTFRRPIPFDRCLSGNRVPGTFRWPSKIVTKIHYYCSNKILNEIRVVGGGGGDNLFKPLRNKHLRIYLLRNRAS